MPSKNMIRHILRCNQCDHLQGGTYIPMFCNLTGKEFTDAEYPLHTAPQWCPLEDTKGVQNVKQSSSRMSKSELPESNPISYRSQGKG